MASHLDHLVLGCVDLARGSAWLERYLGVRLSDVGQHSKMGTHNRLLSLGPGCYLELIAIDAAAETPSTPRWFGLDTTDVQDRIAQRPRLIGWVARTDDITQLMHATGETLGSVHEMSRGDYKWRISVPNDGFPIEGGLIPHLIQWDTPMHPSARLEDQGCRFTWMEAAHPNPAKVQYLLRELGLEHKMVLTPSPPYSGMTLCAYLQTPTGSKTLMS